MVCKLQTLAFVKLRLGTTAHMTALTGQALQVLLWAMVLSCVAGVQSFAQSPNTVTLRYDSNDGITGELLGFSDGVFQIRSSVGQVAIPASDVSCVGAACPEGTRLDVSGGKVVLTSLDGSTVINGDLIEISDGQYVLATGLGELRADVSQVTCEGANCAAEDSKPAFGGQVTLVNDFHSIEGILLDITETAYVITSPVLGDVNVSKNKYDCTGPGCP